MSQFGLKQRILHYSSVLNKQHFGNLLFLYKLISVQLVDFLAKFVEVHGLVK
jgi:hypothetical protein